MIFYWLTAILFKIFAKIFFRLKVEGQEHLPRRGGLILAVNHASSLDPFMITAAIPRYIRWTVYYKYYDRGHLRWLLRQMRFMRIENNLPKEAFRALKRGEIVGLFPEGRRSWDGRLGPARRGVAALARSAAAPVVPVGISGTFTALPRFSRRLKFCPVVVRIGPPLTFPPVVNKEDRDRIDQENALKIMRSIAKLIGR